MSDIIKFGRLMQLDELGKAVEKDIEWLVADHKIEITDAKFGNATLYDIICKDLLFTVDYSYLIEEMKKGIFHRKFEALSNHFTHLYSSVCFNLQEQEALYMGMYPSDLYFGKNAYKDLNLIRVGGTYANSLVSGLSFNLFGKSKTTIPQIVSWTNKDISICYADELARTFKYNRATNRFEGAIDPVTGALINFPELTAYGIRPHMPIAIKE